MNLRSRVDRVERRAGKPDEKRGRLWVKPLAAGEAFCGHCGPCELLLWGADEVRARVVKVIAAGSSMAEL